MRNKKSKLKALVVLFVFFCNGIMVHAQAANISISTAIIPLDATNFVVTATSDGSGNCIVEWDNSTTVNADISRISTGSTIKNINIQPEGTGPGNAETFTFSGLAIDVTHDFTHLTFAGSLQSVGLPPIYCTPTSALPAPVMSPEPATTEGTSNAVYWTNGGVDDATMECNVQVSTTDLNIDPLSYDQESGWQPCPSSATTYDHTFAGLTYNTTYFYHVQTRTPADGLSPFSNVVYSTQIDTTTGGGDDDDDGGGGGRPPTPDPVCGNGSLESGEQCDDGNTVSGDGCSATCDIEHEAAEEQECGNGTLEEGEECDDGNVINGDGCDSACMIEEEELPVCGNGMLEEGEQCDDGNLINGDGCSNICELEAVTVTFEIKGTPEFRVPQQTRPNLSLNSQFLVSKPSIGSLDTVRVKLDDFGNATYEGEIVTGIYDFGLNGEAHNTKILRGIQITPETEVVTLDFTLAETFKLVAGDTVDNNYINGVDMSKLIQQYRMQGTEVLSDLNKEGYVNGIDASILITNYRKAGESF